MSRESNSISYLLSLSFQISTRSHEQSFSSRFWSVLIAEQSLRSKVNLQPRSFFSSLNDLPIKTWKYKREYYTGEFKSQFNRKDASIYEFPVWKISFSFFSIECSHNGIPYILPIYFLSSGTCRSMEMRELLHFSLELIHPMENEFAANETFKLPSSFIEKLCAKKKEKYMI